MIKLRRLLRRLPLRTRKTTGFFYRTLLNFIHADGLICSNSLAYVLSLAFIPFLIAIASISDCLPFSAKLIGSVQHYFFTSFLPQNGDQIYGLFKLSFKQSHNLSAYGIVSLLATAISMMFAVEQHVHKMWHLRRQRRWYRSLLVFSSFLLGGPLMVYTLAALEMSLFKSYTIAVRECTAAGVTSCICILALSGSYKFLPSIKISWRAALFAGTIAGINFSVMRYLFELAIVMIRQQYLLLYGSLAVLPIFLFWLYLSCLNFLYCAQIIYVLELRNKRGYLKRH